MVQRGTSRLIKKGCQALPKMVMASPERNDGLIFYVYELQHDGVISPFLTYWTKISNNFLFDKLHIWNIFNKKIGEIDNLLL
jgi:hypothetical protein